MAFEMYDHNGKAVHHGLARTNGIRMHYTIAGEGPTILLLHGTPKTNAYWYQVMPILTRHFTVVGRISEVLVIRTSLAQAKVMTMRLWSEIWKD